MTGVINIFQQRIDELMLDCARVGNGLRGKDQTQWMLTSKQEGQSPKPDNFDFTGISKMFDREEANKDYIKAISGDGASHTKQDLALLKNQSDYIAGMERDFLMRHRTRIRRLAHESLSRNHAGSERGIFQSGILRYMEYQMQRVNAGTIKNGA